MNEAATRNPRYGIPHFFENPVLRPYLANVRNWQCYIRFLGLPDRHDNPDVIIDRLFVEPLVTRRYVSPDEYPENWMDEAETVVETLETTTAVVLLGDPGIGKSTLLNHVAWLLSRPTTNSLIERMGWRLPLPMVLRELSLRGVQDFEGLLSAFLSHPMSAPLREDRGEYLHRSLADGRAFLLLDGVDEVGDRGARRSLREAVLDGLARYSNCRWLLSSRIVGYDEVPFDMERHRLEEEPVPEEEILEAGADLDRRIFRRLQRTSGKFEGSGFTTRYIAPFDNRRIEALARSWYMQRESTAVRARENASHLVRAVHGDQAIRRLARVPNLLTMMALIHRIEATLPHGRALLYERIAEAYLESIDKFRGIGSSPHDLPRKKGWLARVGFEMQRLRTSREDGEEGTILVDVHTVLGWLSEEMQRGASLLGSPSAQEFLNIVGRRSGLFLPRGEGRYAFVHLSFQEYFAAVAIERAVTRLRWARGTGSRLGFDRDMLREWAADTIWRETFSFVFEVLASGEEDDWHADLLECVFGPDFSRLNASDSEEKADEEYLSLGNLLARLIVNSRSGLPSWKRDAAIASCVGIQLRIQSRSPLRRRFRAPPRWMSQSIFMALLGNDGELDAKIFKEIGVQMLLTGASSLGLMDVKISNVTPLEKLTALRRLGLDGTQVGDVGPLANLTALQSLSLDGTQVADLGPLANLTALQSLSLDGTQVADLGPLANLTALQSLYLDGTQVADLGPLANLTALQSLSLDGTQVADLGPLAKLTALGWLDLEGTQVPDLGPLANLTALEWLDLEGTQISDLGPLANLTALEVLYLTGTQVADLGPLANLTALETLYLTGTQIADLGALANLKGLKRLHLWDTQVSDLIPLANLTALEWLDLDGTRVADVSPLTELTALKYLFLKGTKVLTSAVNGLRENRPDLRIYTESQL